jgi:hypothetical protein
VTVAATFAAVVLLTGAGLAWTARLVHVGNLDALALAEKVATPEPVSALDRPELHVRAIVPLPDERPNSHFVKQAGDKNIRCRIP